MRTYKTRYNHGTIMGDKAWGGSTAAFNGMQIDGFNSEAYAKTRFLYRDYKCFCAGTNLGCEDSRQYPPAAIWFGTDKTDKKFQEDFMNIVFGMCVNQKSINYETTRAIVDVPDGEEAIKERFINGQGIELEPKETDLSKIVATIGKLSEKKKANTNSAGIYVSAEDEAKQDYDQRYANILMQVFACLPKELRPTVSFSTFEMVPPSDILIGHTPEAKKSRTLVDLNLSQNIEEYDHIKKWCLIPSKKRDEISSVLISSLGQNASINSFFEIIKEYLNIKEEDRDKFLFQWKYKGIVEKMNLLKEKLVESEKKLEIDRKTQEKYQETMKEELNRILTTFAQNPQATMSSLKNREIIIQNCADGYREIIMGFFNTFDQLEETINKKYGMFDSNGKKARDKAVADEQNLLKGPVYHAIQEVIKNADQKQVSLESLIRIIAKLKQEIATIEQEAINMEAIMNSEQPTNEAPLNEDNNTKTL